MDKATILYDSRSLDMNRISGWERFSRELYNSLVASEANAVKLRKINSGSKSTLGSLIQDYSRSKRSGLVTHYPTLPPSVSNNKTVFTIHDATWWLYPQYSSKLGGTLLKKLAENVIHSEAQLVTVSQSSKLDLLEIFDISETRVEVAYPGLTALPSNSLSCPNLNGNRPYFLFVGTLEPRKDLATLVKAFEISNLGSQMDLVIVGRIGWNVKAPKGVKYVGTVSDEQLVSWISHAESLVVPSIYEGFGLPIIEAFSLGCPVIASNIGVFQEVSGGLATFFEAQNAESLSEQLLTSLRSKHSTEDLKRRATWFNWSNTAAKYIEIYQKVLNG